MKAVRRNSILVLGLVALTIAAAEISRLVSETLSASDKQAARLDELQFDLGEGPCWDALRLVEPVLEPDLRNPVRSWPAFTDAIRDEVGPSSPAL